MEDFKIILYILAAVAYFLFSQWRKAFSTPKDEENEMPREQRTPVNKPQQPPRPVTTFEDILRELQPKAEKTVAAKPVAEVVQEVKPPLAPEPSPKYKNYETKAPKILSWEKPQQAREAQLRSKELRREAINTKPDAPLPARTKYAALLRNPATVKDAFILSEIFNKKYN